MNIKLTYKEKIYLDQFVFAEYTFGSNFWYDKGADTDVVLLYELPFFWGKEINDILKVNHQFQYDDKRLNAQYVYIEKNQFIRNAIYGDNIINTELILFTDILKNNYGIDIDKYKFAYSYRILKAFLGYSRRDLKSKDWKKILFAYRQLYIVKNVLLIGRVPLLSELRLELSSLSEVNKVEIKTDLIRKENEYRKILNQKLNDGDIKFLPLDCGLFEFNDDLERKWYESLNIKEFKY